MACQPLIIDIDGKVSDFACGPRKKQRPCSVTGCPNPQRYLCDHPLSGAKAGETCSRGLCEKHRGRGVGYHGGNDYCPAHAKTLEDG